MTRTSRQRVSPQTFTLLPIPLPLHNLIMSATSPPTSPLPKRQKPNPTSPVAAPAPKIDSTMSSTAPAITKVDVAPPLLIKRLSEKAKLPTRGSAFAAGYDIYAAKDTVIPARGKVLVDTDISMAVPDGTCLFAFLSFTISPLPNSQLSKTSMLTGVVNDRWTHSAPFRVGIQTHDRYWRWGHRCRLSWPSQGLAV